MRISAKCLTYGRVNLLEEALYSFLQQEDMGDSELVIVNDYPLQTLIFEHPNVRIFNLKETFKTIGEKENFAIENCKGDIIAVWDDDDIASVNHLNNIRKYFKEDINILHWIKGVFYNAPDITEITSVGNSGMVFSKRAWERVGKSPIMNAGGDTTFAQSVHELGNKGIVYASPPDEDVSWWYRWGGLGIYHQSGIGTDVLGKPNIIQRHGEHIEFLRKKGEIPTGDIVLIPKWNKNYTQMLKDYNENKCNSSI